MGMLNIKEPTVFRNFDTNVPDWNFFIQHANNAKNKSGNHIRIFNDYYFVVEVFDDEILETKYAYENFYNNINSNHDYGIQQRPVLLISYFNEVGNLGRHKDPFDQFFWNCIGNTIWEFDKPDGTKETCTLNPGDLMAIPVNTYHNVLSMNPRAGMTFSSNAIK